MAKKTEIVQIGFVGVDSGQLVICDPCYIASEWQQEAFEDIRIYQHKTTGKRLQYRVQFENYEHVIPEYSQTMNQLIATNEWKQVEDSNPSATFSYNGCCKATLSKKGAGQLNYKLGHEGVAVAFRTAYGDGEYPVFAKYQDGVIIEVTVKFI